MAKIDHCLTAEDIRAFRKANRIVLICRNDYSSISARRVKLGSNLREEETWSHTLAVTTRLKSYAEEHRKQPGERVIEWAAHSIYAEQSPEWATVAAMLKPGDNLELVWGEDSHTNPLMRNNGDLHGDHVSLIVWRQKGDKKVEMMFLIEVSIAKYRDTRMVRCFSKVTA